MGRKFTVVTDHKGLEYFKTQPNLSLRQTRWWEYLSHFNYNTIHVDGTQNQVADSLSRYYEYDTIEDEYPNSKFVKADEILDPDMLDTDHQWISNKSVPPHHPPIYLPFPKSLPISVTSPTLLRSSLFPLSHPLSLCSLFHLSVSMPL